MVSPAPPTPPPSLLELPHATEPERLVMSRGNVFLVTSAAGDIKPAGARELGLFHQDTRHLSYYELRLPVGAPTRLSSETLGAVMAQIDLTASDREFGGLLDEPVNFLHVRRKQLLDEEFIDQLVFTNYLGHPIDLEFEIHFDSDYADVFEVRGARRRERGHVLDPVVDVGAGRVQLGYRGVDGLIYRTLVRCSPEPALLEPHRAVFRLALQPGEAQLQEVAFAAVRGEAIEEDRARAPFDVRLARANAETEDFMAQCTLVRADNRILQRALGRGLHDLKALRILHEGRWIVGAGIPWFAAPFGRDALITAAQVLGFAPTLAGETLRFLGLHQGQRMEPIREEEPGRIMHELRRGELARTGEIPHSPYYGSIDATPLYVIVAAETLRWFEDPALLADVWPHVARAMEWLEWRTANGTRFLTYQRAGPKGLENQGWKDSRDGVAFPDGRRARAPIALVEVQGYVVDAYRSAAFLCRLRGDEEAATKWESRIAPFMRRLDEAFWVHETQYYALALDGEGRQVPTISSNPGHLLWSRALGPERARRVADVLLSPEVYSGWGIRTVGRGQTVYNPISYHNGTIWPHDNAIAALGMARYGLHTQAMKVLDGLFAASEQFRYQRLPELFCGMGRGDREFLVQYPVSCSPQAWASGALFMLLQGSLGFEPDAPRKRLTIRNPSLPRSLRRLDLLSMQIGVAQVSLRFERSGRRTHVDVLDVRGGPLRVEIEIE